MTCWAILCAFGLQNIRIMRLFILMLNLHKIIEVTQGYFDIFPYLYKTKQCFKYGKQRYNRIKVVRADKIYLNKANRDILEGYEIHSYCKPLGRPPKDLPSDEMKSRMVKAIGERNEIECSFGTGKRIYRANNIRSKLPDTARCWTGMCYFVKNVMKCLVLTEIWRFFSTSSL